MNEKNIFLQSERSAPEPIQYSKKKECPPGYYVNGKCSEPTVSIDGYLWVLMVVGIILIINKRKKIAL